MWFLLPTTMSNYLYYNPMMLPPDKIEAPVNRKLHLLQPRQAKD